MDKRLFSKLKVPNLTEKQKEITALAPNIQYLVMAEKKKMNRRDTLIIYFFKCENKFIYPEFRIFCQKQDYISQDLTVNKVKWKTACARNIISDCSPWKPAVNAAAASMEDLNLIKQFVLDFYQRRHLDSSQLSDVQTILQWIDMYQKVIMSHRKECRQKKKQKLINEQMSKFGAVPKGYRRYVKNELFAESNYIFYNRKRKTAYCNHCNKDLSICSDGMLTYKNHISSKPIHNHPVRCPACRKTAVCKSDGRGRKNLFSIKWVVLLQGYGNEVVIRYFRHTRDFDDDYRKPQITEKELFRTVYSSDGSKEFMWGRQYMKEEYGWIKYHDPGPFFANKLTYPDQCSFYRNNLNEALSRTWLKYSGIELFAEHLLPKERFSRNPWAIERYIESYRNRPYIEKLLKVGFYHLAEEAICVSLMNNMFCAGSKLPEICKISRSQYKLLAQKGDPTLQDLIILQYAPDITASEYQLLSTSIYADRHKDILSVREYTTVHKLLRYFEKNNIGKENISDYFDYFNWMKKLGYDLKNPFNLFPKDFYKKHDEKQQEYQIVLNTQSKLQYELQNKKIRMQAISKRNIPVFHMHKDGLLIRLPRSGDELKREGEALHHCVGNYVEDVANEKTAVFFIRQEANCSESYYTLEWRDGKVIQCQGKFHCKMNSSVESFVNDFTERMLNYEQNRKAAV